MTPVNHLTHPNKGSSPTSLQLSIRVTILGHDRFESTASAGRRIPGASLIDLPLPIPVDPLPSFTKGGGRR